MLPACRRVAYCLDDGGNRGYGAVDQFVHELAGEALDGLCLLPREAELSQDALGLAGTNAFGAVTRVRSSPRLGTLRFAAYRSSASARIDHRFAALLHGAYSFPSSYRQVALLTRRCSQLAARVARMLIAASRT